MNVDQIFAEILANPDDDAPRVRYADAVGGDHAKFIHEGIGLRDLRRRGVTGQYLLPSLQRLAALAKKHPEWGADVLKLVDAVDFGRGFVERVTLPVTAFLERAPAIYAKAPVIHAHFTGAHGHCAALAASPHVAQLRSLDLSLCQLDDADVAALAASHHFGKLRFLELKQNHIGDAGVEALAAATASRFPSLRYVGLMINKCTDPTDEAMEDENGQFSFQERNAGIALERKHGALPWLHFRATNIPDPDAAS